MKKLLFLLLLTARIGFAQSHYQIFTQDIPTFWAAVDQLPENGTYADSLQIFQTQYLDRLTPAGREFIKRIDYDAEEYLNSFAAHPNFWRTIREPTLRTVSDTAQLRDIFAVYERELPGYRQPDVAFVIGCLRSGGTASSKTLFVGVEMMGLDNTVDRSELNDWLKNVLPEEPDLPTIVAHETIHTQQPKLVLKATLARAALMEGVCDFIPDLLFGRNANPVQFEYGEAHECALWQEFLADEPHEKDAITDWMYQGDSSKDRPADLAYYIGYKIAAAYYEQATDKRKALKELIDFRRAKKILAAANYDGGCR